MPVAGFGEDAAQALPVAISFWTPVTAALALPAKAAPNTAQIPRKSFASHWFFR